MIVRQACDNSRAVSAFPHLLRQALRAACVLLLFASHLAASTVAADCASRCLHSCCRVDKNGGAGAHCDMAEHAASRSCGVKARCTHSQQGAITALPLLRATEGPRLRLPDAVALATPAAHTRPHGPARAIDAPPPRVLA